MERDTEATVQPPASRVTPQLATELVNLLDGSMRIEDFVATVVHEASQPLTAIQVLAAALRTAGDTMAGEQKTRMLLEIESQAQFLHELSSWMLKPFARESVVFDFLVERAAARCRALAPVHTISTDLAAGDAVVNCETVRVEASIRNLVLNSATNSPPGSEIIVRTFREGNLACVAVSDCGAGIPENEWERIFHPYAKLSGERAPASGLGLFIVRSCAVQHGGHARVASSGPDGTSMELALRVGV